MTHPQNIAKQLWLLFFLVVFLSKPGFSNGISIFGYAPKYNKDTISFYHFPDPVTNVPVEIGKCPVDEFGAFRFDFESDEVWKVFADLGMYQTYLFAKPGMEYEVILPPKKEKSLNDILNPYFQPQSVHLGILHTDSRELNFLIRSFEQKYQAYLKIKLISFYNTLEVEPLDSFILNTDMAFNTTDKYFNDYKKFKYKLLLLLNPITGAKMQLYSNFPVKEILYENTAYMEYFNQVFRNFLKTISRLPEGDKLRFDIEKKMSYEALQQTISGQFAIHDDQLLEFILLKALYDECFDSDFHKSSLLKLIKEIEMTSEYSKHRLIARNIIWKVSRLDPGKTAPEFSLTDQNGQKLSLQDFRGKFVYLHFSSFACYNCLRHYPLLQEIQNNYLENLTIITISVDKSYEEMKSKLKSKPYPWHFVFYGKQEKLMIDYGVRIFPSYVLIDPKGNLVNSFAPSPLEGFDAWFEGIMKKYKPLDFRVSSKNNANQRFAAFRDGKELQDDLGLD